MRSYFNLRKAIAATVTAAGIFGMSALTGCSTTADPTLGYEIVPEHQKMVMRHLTFKGGKVIRFDAQNSTDDESRYTEKAAPSGNFFETSLYRTDSLLSSNITYGYFGIERSDTFGMRKAAFATSMVCMDSVSATEGFGYKPIFDTMHLLLTIEDFRGDTLTPVKYNVYELVKPLLGNAIDAKDTSAYVNVDLSGVYDPSKPLFTFTFPDGEKTGPTTTSVAMTPVDMSADGATWDFVRRLMLIPENYNSPEWDGYANDGLEYYDDEEKFMEKFYGVYIAPDIESMPQNGSGAMFNTRLSGSGLYLEGRTRNPDDPTLIKDTVGMSYYFNYLYIDGNMSANKIEHDLSSATVPFSGGKTVSEIVMDAHDASNNKVPRENRTKVETCYVEGMAGAITELYFTDDFIDELRAISDEQDESYSLVGINQCLIYFYLTGADYDWNVTQGNAALITPKLDASIGRLGIYTNFNSLTNIVDYDYVYEQTYSTTVNYDGNLNRSRACYMMNITGYMQQLLNYVRTLEKGADGKYAFDENAADYVPRTIYIGPEAISPYTFKRSIIQGMEGAENAAPIHVELTYTLFR